jgi:hypothetical protein
MILAVSADSKLRGVRQSYCKIRQIGPFVLAASGYVFNPSRSYDVFSIANKSFGIFDAFSDAESALIGHITPKLSSALEELRRNDIREYREDTKKREALKLVLLRYEDAPWAAVITFRLTNRETVPVHIVANDPEECPGEGCPKGYFFEVFGSKEEVATFRASHQKWAQNPIQEIQSFISLEISQGGKDKFGPPRTTVQLLRGDRIQVIESGSCE